MPIQLSAEQVADYQRDGFLVVPDVLCAEEAGAFLSHQAARPEEYDLGLRSHVVDPQWRYLATHRNVAGVAEQLIGGTPCVVQTMYLPKPAGENAVGIALHQDAHYLPTEPDTLMACWIALSDTDGDNGGFCAVPGSHLDGVRSWHVSQGDEHSNWSADQLMRDRAGREWTQTFHSFEVDDLDPASVRRLEVPAGSAVFFTGLTVHGSYANRSADRARLAWAVHYVKEGSWISRADVQETVSVPELAAAGRERSS